MNIFKKIRIKWHNEIFDILSILKDKLDLLISKQCASDELVFKISHSLEKLKQIDEISVKLDFLITKQYATDQLISKYGEEIATNSNSIFSYCNNEMIKKSVGFKMTDIYGYYKKLHELTKLHNIATQGVKKIRVGREHDGGYVMIEPFSSTKIAYSLGIADDVSWDDAMADYGYNLYQYDHTIEGLPKVRPEFHWKKLGLTGYKETENLKHLNTLIHDNGHDNCTGMILKMDIENYEWDVLNITSQDVLDRFDQIVMEIHGLNDLNQSQRTIEVLKKLSHSFTTVHIHANNYRYAAFCGTYITPDVLEITMVKTSLYDFDIDSFTLMNTIDQVNRAQSQDIWIGEW